MGQDRSNIDLVYIVVDHGNQSVLVASDIEDRIFPYLVRTAEDFLNVGEVFPLGRLHDADPMAQRPFRIGMKLPELFERSLRDQVHSREVSQSAKFSSSRLFSKMLNSADPGL